MDEQNKKIITLQKKIETLHREIDKLHFNEDQGINLNTSTLNQESMIIKKHFDYSISMLEKKCNRLEVIFINRALFYSFFFATPEISRSPPRRHIFRRQIFRCQFDQKFLQTIRFS